MPPCLPSASSAVLCASAVAPLTRLACFCVALAELTPKLQAYVKLFNGDNTEEIAELFAKMDADGSGAVSLEEAKAAGGDASFLEAADADGDGQLTEAEVAAQLQRNLTDAGNGESYDLGPTTTQ